MSRSIGVMGVLGLLVVLAGIGVIAYENPILAGGMVAILVGVALVVVDFIKRAMAKLGFGAMMG